jgi:hypothetical protein
MPQPIAANNATINIWPKLPNANAKPSASPTTVPKNVRVISPQSSRHFSSRASTGHGAPVC